MLNVGLYTYIIFAVQNMALKAAVDDWYITEQI